MNRHPLAVIQKNGPDIFEALLKSSSMALGEGALPAKVKYLIAMALDASHGAAGGVKSLAEQALAHGATKDEIFDALRVTYHICGAGSIYTAAQGLNDLFGDTPAP